MNGGDQKTIDRLVQAINVAYQSPGRMFWRGLLWGLGRGIGTLVGWLLLLAILVYLFKISGLDRVFGELMDTVNKLSGSVNSLR